MRPSTTSAKYSRSDEEILRYLQKIFEACPRPEHFTPYDHCDECREHDEVLRRRDLDTLSLEDVGNPAWDPVCFMLSEGLAYYFPALARLALEAPGPDRDWYGAQLVFHLWSGGPYHRHLSRFTRKQREAVADFLLHLVETRARLADEYDCSYQLIQAIEVWTLY